MKEIILTTEQIKKEILIYLGCLTFGILLNIIAILSYETSFSELWSELPFVLVLSLAFYAVISLFRVLYLGFRKLF